MVSIEGVIIHSVIRVVVSCREESKHDMTRSQRTRNLGKMKIGK